MTQREGGRKRRAKTKRRRGKTDPLGRQCLLLLDRFVGGLLELGGDFQSVFAIFWLIASAALVSKRHQLGGHEVLLIERLLFAVCRGVVAATDLPIFTETCHCLHAKPRTGNFHCIQKVGVILVAAETKTGKKSGNGKTEQSESNRLIINILAATAATAVITYRVR